VVICVTLNPAIDAYLEVKKLIPGSFHRTEKEIYSPGGKGFIAAEILMKLGYSDVLSTGLLAGRNGLAWEDSATQRGVPGSYVYIHNGNTRRNIQIVDLTESTVTSIGTKGPEASPQDIEKLKKRLRPHLGRAEWILFGGSLPSGLSPDTYYELIKYFNGLGKKTVINATIEYLPRAADAIPFMLVEDPKEGEEHFGDIEVHSLEDEIKLAKSLMDRGIQVVSLSWQVIHNVIGIYGNVYHVHLVDPHIFSVVGANSALTAGLIHAIISGMEGPDIAKHAVATAYAVATKLEPDIDGIVQVQKVYEYVEVEKVL
jgi:1-phosphofructokinase family hexose kinase